MNDLISRQAALEMLNDDELERQTDDVFDGNLHRYKRAAQRIVAQLPTIDPVKHGEWSVEYGRFGRHIYFCSQCRNYSSEDFPYCHWCGARMETDE